MGTHQHAKALKNRFVGHEKVVYTGSFEVQPVDTRKYKWKGAFVYCYVVASDAKVAAKLIRQALKEDGYRVIRQESCRKHSSIEWEKPSDTRRANLLANKARKAKDVVYDYFYCYDRD